MIQPQARLGLAAILPLIVAMLLGGCGSSSGGQQTGMITGGTSQPPAETGTIPGSTSGVRGPPIIYRPPSLSRSQKVPLVIALHGGMSGPQNMQGLTHFEELGDQHGFVVAYLDSSSQTNPWNPRTNDLAYVSATIDRLESSENIDPNRIYMTGFSAGGNETFRSACYLSKKLAAVAIVAYDFGGALYHTCHPSRPVSELLIIGNRDGVRFTGVPGRAGSAYQTTAKWRTFDGCSPTPVRSQQVSTVLQQTWTACTDRSAVGLYVIEGGGHDWPPFGPGAPPDYSASAAIWAFFAAHPADPRPLASEVKLLGAHVQGTSGGRTVVASFSVAESMMAQQVLKSGRTTVAVRRFRLSRPLSKTTWLVPKSLASGRYSLQLALTDFYGRRLVLSRVVVLPPPTRG